LSLGTDLGLGQPMEHMIRACLIALRLAESAAIDDAERGVVYYSGLLAPGAQNRTICVQEFMLKTQPSAFVLARRWRRAVLGRLMACQVPVVRAGLARVTWSRARSRVRSVRSSCEALAAKRRWASKEASSRAKRVVEGVAEFLELVIGSVQVQPLVQAAGGDPAGGGGDRAQQAQHPGPDPRSGL
jgi:hypothetical protein